MRHRGLGAPQAQKQRWASSGKLSATEGGAQVAQTRKDADIVLSSLSLQCQVYQGDDAHLTLHYLCLQSEGTLEDV